MKRILILAIMMLIGSTTIVSFATNHDSINSLFSQGPGKPVHRSPRMSYINGYMDNDIYTLTFAKVYDNVEI